MSGALKAVLPSLCISIAALVGAYFVLGDTKTALYCVAAGAAAGAVLAFLASCLRQSDLGALVTALGLAAFAVGTDKIFVRFEGAVPFAGLVVGLAAGSLPSLVLKRRAPQMTAIAVLVAGVLALMSLHHFRQSMHQVAELAVWSALLAVGLQWGLKRALGAKAPWIGPAVGLVALAGLGWLSFAVYFGEKPLAIVSLVAVAAALVTAWSVKEQNSSIVSWGASALIWLGLATFAFSQAQGLGMGAASFFGVAALLVLGRRDLLPSVGIVAGLSFYRLFREGNDEVIEAFDIGQHYAMVGFLVGVVVAVATVDALSRRTKSGVAGGAVVAVIAMLVVVGATAFFGNKGAIGLLVGLGIAPMVVRLTPDCPGWSVLVAGALQCVTMVAFGPLAQQASFEHDQKVKLLVILTVVGLALAGLVWLLERERKAVARAEA